MHKLVRICLQNWYLVDNFDIDIEGATALIGPTGSGKTSIFDAIQTVLAGNRKQILRLNAAADAGSHRTVREYCLGIVGDNEKHPKRDRCETVLALVFRPDGGGLPLTIGIVMEASIDEPKEIPIVQFIAPGLDYRAVNTIVRDDDGSQYILPWREFEPRLKEMCPDIQFYRANPRHFVEDYLTKMRGPRAKRPNAQHFLRALRNAIAYRAIDDTTRFVRSYLLEPYDLQIDSVRQHLDAWREITDKIRRIEDQIADLKRVRTRFTTWAKHHNDASNAQGVAYLCQIARKTGDLDEAKVHIADLERQCLAQTNIAERFALEKKKAEESLQHLYALLSASDSQVKINAVNGQIEMARRDEASATDDIRMILDLCDRAFGLDAARVITPASFHDALDAAKDFHRSIAALPDNISTFIREGDTATALFERIRRLGDLAARLETRHHDAAFDLTNTKAELADLDRRLADAQKGKILLDPDVREFVAELAKHGIEAEVLPDIVEIVEEGWAEALEKLLGDNRQAVIVPPASVRDAFDILFRGRQRFHRCRLVRTDRIVAGADRVRVLDRSISEIVRTDNPYARTFIDHNVGRFVKAETRFDLEQCDFGIMRDGHVSAGLSYRAHRNLTPILGKTAQASAIALLEAECKAKRERLAELEQERTLLKNTIGSSQRIAYALESRKLDAAEAAFKAGQARLDMARLEAEKTALENEADAELRSDIDSLKEDITGYGEEVDTATKAATEFDKQVFALRGTANALDREIANLQDELKEFEDERLQTQEQRLIVEALRLVGETALFWSQEKENFETQHQLQAGLSNARKFLAETHDRSVRRVEELTSHRSNQVDRAKTSAIQAFQEYLSRFGEAGKPVPDDAPTVEFFDWVILQTNRLESNVLREYQGTATETYKTLRVALKEDLLTRLAERLDGVRSQLDIINRQLAAFTFVGRVYSFRSSINPEFEAMHKLAKQIKDDPHHSEAILGDDANDLVKAAMREFELMLTDDEKVSQFSDYRNYFNFSIKMTSPSGEVSDLDKRSKKASAGEGQIPYYVAIAASLRLAYFPGSISTTPEGMGIAMFDEAFEKIDIAHSQKIVHYFATTGLQMLVAAPEPQRPMLMETMNTIVNVSRIPDTTDVFIDVERIGPQALDELRAANPEYLGYDGMKKKMEEEGTVLAEGKAAE